MTRSDVRSLPALSRWGRFAPRHIPTWVTLVGMYSLSRIVTTSVLAVVYVVASSAGSGFAGYSFAPDPASFLESWDGQWYRTIALHGYPTTLPIESGQVQQNEWAFLPLFPLLTRGLMTVTGFDFAVVSTTIAMAFGGGATLLLYGMLVGRVGRRPAVWAAALFCFGPLSFVLQVAYAESLFLFLMFGAVAALSQRRYVAMALFGVPAAFAHPGALALAVALGIHVIRRQREVDLFSRVERIKSIVVGVVLTISGFAWPVIADLVTGRTSAYFDTEMAWWRDYLGPVGFVPFTPWFSFAQRYLGVFGCIAVVLAIAVTMKAVTRQRIRVIGADPLFFAAGYIAYLVAVFLPQQSIFRMLLPLAPLLGDPALTGARAPRKVLLASSIALQPVAVTLLWVIWPP